MAGGRAPLRDAQPLPDSNHVGILEAVPVRLEDLGVEVAVAVVLLGDLPERLTLLHLVPLRGIPGPAAALLLGGGHVPSFGFTSSCRRPCRPRSCPRAPSAPRPLRA